MKKRSTVALLVLSLAINCFEICTVASLYLSKGGIGRKTHPVFEKIGLRRSTFFDRDDITPAYRRSSDSTTLGVGFIIPITKAATAVSPRLRNAILLVAAAVAIAKRQRIFYPGTSPDPNYSEPLPPGSFGCPFIGSGNVFQGTKANGPGEFFRRTWLKLGKPRLFKYLFFGQPMVSVTGMKNIKQLLGSEFKNVQTSSPPAALKDLLGKESLIMSLKSDEHSFQRRLVGSSMTPEAIDMAIPSLQKTVTEQIDALLEMPTVVMEDVCTNFTLDVAWRQILGLNLDEAEVPAFRQAVSEWVMGLLDLRLIFLPITRFTKAGRAKAQLISLIEKRIDELKKNGPDGSTISAMVFAKDDSDGSRLSRQQIIDNSLALILAGSETTASTLTVGMLLLGLHHNVYEKLKDEQRALASKDAGVLTLEQLNKECPYLDVVIKEIMRLKTISEGGPSRTVFKTLVVDGMQIPKGYTVGFNIQRTHANDPVTSLPDGSHMDVVEGFKPERWLNPSTRPSEFLPFGYGARYCLGSNLAIAEMKVFLALLARRVDFDLVNMSKDHVTWKKMSIIPKPEDGTVIAPRPSSFSNVDASTRVLAA